MEGFDFYSFSAHLSSKKESEPPMEAGCEEDYSITQTALLHSLTWLREQVVLRDIALDIVRNVALDPDEYHIFVSHICLLETGQEMATKNMRYIVQRSRYLQEVVCHCPHGVKRLLSKQNVAISRILNVEAERRGMSVFEITEQVSKYFKLLALCINDMMFRALLSGTFAR